jgi:hypothetical protein
MAEEGGAYKGPTAAGARPQFRYAASILNAHALILF